jgi:hypothetical protein
MYKKGVAVELEFSPERLNDGAGDPYWIDLTHDEAQRLLESLQVRLASHSASTEAPLVVSLDETPAARNGKARRIRRPPISWPTTSSSGSA